MTMARTIIVMGGVGIGSVVASYYLNGTIGKKRRVRIRRTLEGAVRAAGDVSQEFLNTAVEVSRDAARKFDRNATRAVAELRKKKKWSPSARLLGALGGAIAFYGAGRQGIFGFVLRTLSLSMFTRALLTAR